MWVSEAYGFEADGLAAIRNGTWRKVGLAAMTRAPAG